jgi:hypothetical protein
MRSSRELKFLFLGNAVFAVIASQARMAVGELQSSKCHRILACDGPIRHEPKFRDT